MELIQTIQDQIESIYGIKTGASVLDYLISRNELSTLMPQSTLAALPKELFLVNPEPKDETIEVALYLADDLKSNLSTHNPLQALSQENISDFCTLIEGVSHFVYYLHKASLEYEITQLEMELQAEIDKFLLLSILTKSNLDENQQLLELLFENYLLHEHLDDDQKIRYNTATDLARKYCFQVTQNIRTEGLPSALKKVRKFYPMTQEQKIKSIVN